MKDATAVAGNPVQVFLWLKRTNDHVLVHAAGLNSFCFSLLLVVRVPRPHIRARATEALLFSLSS